MVHLLVKHTVNSVLGICYCVHLFQHAPYSPVSLYKTTNKEEAEQAWRANQKKPSAGLSRSSNLHRSGSIKDLIDKFSGPFSGTGQITRSTSKEVLVSPKSKLSPFNLSNIRQDDSQDSSIDVTSHFNDTSQNGTEEVRRVTKTSQITARIDCPTGGSTKKSDSKQRKKTQMTDYGGDSVSDSGMGSVSKKESLSTVHFTDLA